MMKMYSRCQPYDISSITVAIITASDFNTDPTSRLTDLVISVPEALKEREGDKAAEG